MMTSRLVGFALAITISILFFQAYWDSIANANGFSHLIGSLLVVGLMFVLTNNLAMAVVVAIGCGVLKELDDPVFSHLDICMDLIGVLIGVLIVNAFKVKYERR